MMQLRSHSRGSIRPLPSGSSLAERPGSVRQPLGKGHWPAPSDDPCGIQIGIDLIAALRTSEDRLLRTVDSVFVATAGAGLRGLARVAEDHWDAQAPSLVDNKVGKLTEGPRAQHAVEPLAAADAAANPVQAFKDDHWIGILTRKINDLFRDLVVLIAHPTRLSPLHSLDAIRALVVSIAATQIRKVFSALSGRLAVEEDGSIRRGDDGMSDDTQINADEGLTGTSGGRWGYANGQHDIPSVTALKELGVSVSKCKPINVFLWYAQGKPDILSSKSGRDPQGPKSPISLECVGVDAETDSLRFAHLGEGCPLFGLAQPIEGSSQRDGSVDRHASVVRGETELSGRLIHELMQLGAIARLMILGFIQSKLHGLAECLSRLFKPPALSCIRRLDLERQRQTFCAVHRQSITHIEGGVKDRRAAIPPRAKALGFLAA